MKNKSGKRVCKNKKCQKVLPSSYKYKYCEACRNKHTYTIRNVVKNAAAITGGIALVAASVITGKEINSKK